MGLIANKLGIRAFSLEDPAQPLMPYSSLVESLGIGQSDAGVMVNEAQALRITTAFACIMIVSSDLSTLRRSIYQRMPDGSIREALEHPLYSLICERPTSATTGVALRGAEIASMLGWGNAYTVIRRQRGGKPDSLALLPPSKTSPVIVDGEVMYGTTHTKDGMVSYIKREDMLHVPDFTLDGVVGLSPIQQCKNAFGLAIAAERFGAQFFGNGARTTGVFTHPGVLDDEAYRHLKDSIQDKMTGANALRPFLVEDGMKWEQISIAPNDAQFLETRKFQRSEIAALFRVPMHLLQDLERSTNNNIEHQSLDYIRYCLRPRAVRIEQEINSKLLGKGFFCEHDFNDFQRGDFASQTTGLATLRAAGFFNVNDGLRALRMNTISEEDGGNIRLAPLNSVPLTSLVNYGDANASQSAGTDPPAAPGEAFTDRNRQTVINSYRRLFRDAVGRTVNRQNADETFIYRAFQPTIAALAQVILNVTLGSTGELTDDDDAKVNAHAKRIAAEASVWVAKDAAAIATRLTDEAYNALFAALIG
jgi:HK97 family phage portal protein